MHLKSQWEIVKLGDYIESCLGKMLDAKKNKGIFQPYLGNSNVRWGHFEFTDLAQMRFESHEEARYGIQNGDLIVCEGGEPGRCAIWRDELPNMKIQKALHRIRPKNGLDIYYLYYWFLMAGRNGWLEPYFTGTTIKHLTGKALTELKVPLPPIIIQREISDILSTIDDKIFNNTMINHSLLKMAQMAFEQLIIDEAINEPLSVLSDIADINPPRPLKKGAEAVYIEMANLPTSSSFPVDWTIRTFSGGMRFKNGDTIMARITPCLENGKTAYINFLGDDEIAYGSTEYIVISPKQGYCHEMFYFLARHNDFVNYAVKNMNGSSGRQRVSGATIGAYELHIPSSVAIEEFSEIAKPIMKVIASNSIENRNLAALRDSLLPRLMLGGLSVSIPDEK